MSEGGEGVRHGQERTDSVSAGSSRPIQTTNDIIPSAKVTQPKGSARSPAPEVMISHSALQRLQSSTWSQDTHLLIHLRLQVNADDGALTRGAEH